MKKPTLPSLTKVKKALHDDWALRVKQRDGWKCLLCGATENLTAHHWYICDHNAHAARYATTNGASLCYACHIRGIHTRADWKSVNGLYLRLLASGAVGVYDPGVISQLAKVELTTPVLRNLYDEMQRRVVFIPDGAWYVDKKGLRGFWYENGPHPFAVVGNVIAKPPVSDDPRRYVVDVVKKTDGGYRYSVTRILFEESQS